jgi:hypothetical protein
MQFVEEAISRKRVSLSRKNMARILDEIATITEGKSYNSFKYSFDSLRSPLPSYEASLDGGDSIWNNRGETLCPHEPIDLTSEARKLSLYRPEPCLRYFLDGSRHIYHVDDISYSKRVFPVIAGQIGVACCYRKNGKLSVVQPSVNELVIALPDKCDKDGRHPTQFNAYICEQINKNERLQRLGIKFATILTYKTDSVTRDDNFRDRGIARIQDYMIDAEKRMVDTLAKANKFGNNEYLVKDGSLEYAEVANGTHKDIRTFKDSFRWVIGVSKSFNPENCRDGSGKSGKGKLMPMRSSTSNSFTEPLLRG